MIPHFITGASIIIDESHRRSRAVEFLYFQNRFSLCHLILSTINGYVNSVTYLNPLVLISAIEKLGCFWKIQEIIPTYVTWSIFWCHAPNYLKNTFGTGSTFANIFNVQICLFAVLSLNLSNKMLVNHSFLCIVIPGCTQCGL